MITKEHKASGFDKKLFSVVLPIHWGDMDALGHLNNIFYFRYMEESRIKWLQSLGERIDGAAQGPVLYDAHCTYFKPVVYPEDLKIDLYSEPPRRSSFNLIYNMYSAKSDQMVSQGKTKVVWVDYSKMKSISLPEAIKNIL